MNRISRYLNEEPIPGFKTNPPPPVIDLDSPDIYIQWETDIVISIYWSDFDWRYRIAYNIVTGAIGAWGQSPIRGS
jgi:hypothetical protein